MQSTSAWKSKTLLGTSFCRTVVLIFAPCSCAPIERLCIPPRGPFRRAFGREVECGERHETVRVLFRSCRASLNYRVDVVAEGDPTPHAAPGYVVFFLCSMCALSSACSITLATTGIPRGAWTLTEGRPALRAACIPTHICATLPANRLHSHVIKCTDLPQELLSFGTHVTGHCGVVPITFPWEAY